ncbi:hypothetical protein AVEN_58905-1 [Araneus ventricosus]|uniref:Uncharacterized protein n=1 Tax=Araneus ventricosus TaxID=182803 RepID=A0A4Y2WTM9_ARAVE|nr:hypothetical protein AVEN_58905-1 [Araneus ventricosus]
MSVLKDIYDTSSAPLRRSVSNPSICSTDSTEYAIIRTKDEDCNISQLISRIRNVINAKKNQEALPHNIQNGPRERAPRSSGKKDQRSIDNHKGPRNPSLRIAYTHQPHATANSSHKQRLPTPYSRTNLRLYAKKKSEANTTKAKEPNNPGL